MVLTIQPFSTSSFFILSFLLYQYRLIPVRQNNWLIYRWINTQPGIKIKVLTFMQSLSGYLWLNNRFRFTVYSNTAVYGGNECVISRYLSIFTSLKHLMMLLKCFFSGLHFYTLSKTLIACRAMQLRFL